MRNGAAVVGTIGLGVAFTRIVEAIVAIKIACSRVALRVTFAIIDVPAEASQWRQLSVSLRAREFPLPSPIVPTSKGKWSRPFQPWDN
eukprot:scaffold238579_cov33-Tisochrysis_lutea.AAC.3